MSDANGFDDLSKREELNDDYENLSGSPEKVSGTYNNTRRAVC